MTPLTPNGTAASDPAGSPFTPPQNPLETQPSAKPLCCKFQCKTLQVLPSRYRGDNLPTEDLTTNRFTHFRFGPTISSKGLSGFRCNLPVSLQFVALALQYAVYEAVPCRLQKTFSSLTIFIP